MKKSHAPNFVDYIKINEAIEYINKDYLINEVYDSLMQYQSLYSGEIKKGDDIIFSMEAGVELPEEYKKIRDGIYKEFGIEIKNESNYYNNADILIEHLIAAYRAILFKADTHKAAVKVFADRFKGNHYYKDVFNFIFSSDKEFPDVEGMMEYLKALIEKKSDEDLKKEVEDLNYKLRKKNLSDEDREKIKNRLKELESKYLELQPGNVRTIPKELEKRKTEYDISKFKDETDPKEFRIINKFFIDNEDNKEWDNILKMLKEPYDKIGASQERINKMKKNNIKFFTKDEDTIHKILSDFIRDHYDEIVSDEPVKESMISEAMGGTEQAKEIFNYFKEELDIENISVYVKVNENESGIGLVGVDDKPEMNEVNVVLKDLGLSSEGINTMGDLYKYLKKEKGKDEAVKIMEEKFDIEGFYYRPKSLIGKVRKEIKGSGLAQGTPVKQRAVKTKKGERGSRDKGGMFKKEIENTTTFQEEFKNPESIIYSEKTEKPVESTGKYKETEVERELPIKHYSGSLSRSGGFGLKGIGVKINYDHSTVYNYVIFDDSIVTEESKITMFS